jgi:hypothetical protein
MRLSPLDPLRWVFYGGLAHAHFGASRCEEAIEWAERAWHAQPRMPAVVAIKAAACAHLGRVEDASACVRRFCELRPGATIGSVRATLGTALSPKFLAVYCGYAAKADSDRSRRWREALGRARWLRLRIGQGAWPGYRVVVAKGYVVTF